MNKTLSLLGLSKVSGNIVFGEKLIHAIANNQTYLVMLASDAAANNAKKIKNKTAFYNATLIIAFTKAQISKAIGSQNIVAVGILNKELANKIKKELED